MTTTAERPGGRTEAGEGLLDRAPGMEPLGTVHGSGYKEGAALVRRPDGQMVQLGPLMYALFESADGHRTDGELARAMSAQLGRRVEEAHVRRLAEKLAAQGLLAGSEHRAPPRRNPLLALRWKVLVTKPTVTRWLTTPFIWLFRPVVLWPMLAAFVGVCWFVLIDKGVASATAQAFHQPGLLLLIFGLAVVSAAFHELGHAAACRYGGATPSGMGMGLYLVWPAFYTDVTDAYRLDRRSRLRVDLGGLYFNAVVAVITMGVWLIVRTDALLLLVALQLLQMVKQLSPVIRADGYHILADATGVPDLFAHIGPTLRRLLPGHRGEPSALNGRARLLVSVWVLVVIPVLLSLMLSAILVLPRLLTTAWDSGRHLVSQASTQAGHGDVLGVLASALLLLALLLPVAGSLLMVQKAGRTMVSKARRWSAGHSGRRATVLVVGVGLVSLLAWAWWPAGQYQPVRASDKGTLISLVHTLGSPASVVRPAPAVSAPSLAPGRYVALAMVPAAGVSAGHPAYFVLPGPKGSGPVAVLSDAAPTGATGGLSTHRGTFLAAAFPFVLPKAPGKGGTQAEALNTTNGGVVYNVAYAIVTVSGGQAVTNTNSAYALASCDACTTVAVSFQVILVVGQSQLIAPINSATALNYRCPSCMTTAIADQLVLSLSAQPSPALLREIQAALEQLNALPALRTNGTPATVAAEVAAVQQEIQGELNQSGLSARTPIGTGSSGTGSSGTGSTSTTVAPSAPSGQPSPTTGASGTSSTSGSSLMTTTTTTAPDSTTTTTLPGTSTTTDPPG